uniref:Uncharacterized protein LOC112807135 isoform X3 n=1 Tax=Callorhinus ursinus TaxID=34884 RepID=A0A3Q7NQE4_CALUR|nr:uncharacterized protein LOC112807135 isoform X3 [Callorhinus ursinus]
MLLRQGPQEAHTSSISKMLPPPLFLPLLWADAPRSLTIRIFRGNSTAAAPPRASAFSHLDIVRPCASGPASSLACQSLQHPPAHHNSVQRCLYNALDLAPVPPLLRPSHSSLWFLEERLGASPVCEPPSLALQVVRPTCVHAPPQHHTSKPTSWDVLCQV